MGHTDVVPANASAWQRDPFGAEVVVGIVWGRGAADRRAETIRTDDVITESGGVPVPTRSGPVFPVAIGEKGVNWRRIIVGGTAGHGSMPFRTDNALVTAAEVIRRIAAYQPRPTILDVWRRYLEAIDL